MLYRQVVKQLCDRLIAVAALIVVLPLTLLLALLVAQRLGRPVLFRQVRIGRHDRPFGFLKFRSMTRDRDELGNLLPDEMRLTPFGRFLRASSLDEIPQLWNVAKGEMSLIGPRPLLPEYLPRYSASQRRRHEVKPGITGLAQVRGRNAISWEQKFEWDVWYVDHCSLKLDLEILCMTLACLIRREGISQKGHATAAPFMGSANGPYNKEASQ